MSTEDKSVESNGEEKSRKSKREDPATPLGKLIAKEAKESKSRKQNNTVVDKWYELRGYKLTLVKRTKSGSVYRTFLGSTEDKKNASQMKSFLENIKKSGKLKVVPL